MTVYLDSAWVRMWSKRGVSQWADHVKVCVLTTVPFDLVRWWEALQVRRALQFCFLLVGVHLSVLVCVWLHHHHTWH